MRRHRTRDRAPGAAINAASRLGRCSDRGIAERTAPTTGATARARADQVGMERQEIRRLKDLWPANSARSIARQLERGVDGVRNKALRLNLKKAAAPVVTAKPSPRAARPAPRPCAAERTREGDQARESTVRTRSQSSNIDRDSAGGSTGRVMYCGAPIVGASS